MEVTAKSEGTYHVERETFPEQGRKRHAVLTEGFPEKVAKEKATKKPETNTFPPKDSNDNNLSSLQNNSSVSGFDCSLCQVKCSRKRTFNDHLIGKQHKKKLEMLQAPNRNFRCEICNVEAKVWIS